MLKLNLLDSCATNWQITQNKNARVIASQIAPLEQDLAFYEIARQHDILVSLFLRLSEHAQAVARA